MREGILMLFLRNFQEGLKSVEKSSLGIGTAQGVERVPYPLSCSPEESVLVLDEPLLMKAPAGGGVKNPLIMIHGDIRTEDA